MKTAAAIVTQSTGREKDDKTPGIGNFILAEVAHRLGKEFNLPILPQGEVYEAEVRMRKESAFSAACIADKTTDGKSTLEWNTRTVAMIQKEWLCEKRIPLRAILVASPIHMVRAKLVYERLGFEVFPAPMPRGQYFTGAQREWYLRSTKGVCAYEFVVRMLFLAKGWI